MNISFVNPIAGAVAETLTQAQTPQQVSDRTKLVQAVKVVNDSKALGDNNELTFVLDRTSHRTLTRIIDRQTQEVVMQIPPEYVLQLAEQLKQDSSTGSR